MKPYDSDRFRVQVIGVNSALDHVFGYGPGQFEGVIFQKSREAYSAHSIYARLLLENGIIGFVLLMALFLYLLVKLFKIKKVEENNHLNSIYIAILTSLLVNSLVIDTLHWRHYWLFIGLSLAYISEFQVVKIPEWSISKGQERLKYLKIKVTRKIRTVSFFLIRNILVFLGMFRDVIKGHENEVLILMYHRVNNDIDFELSVKKKHFNWQMEYLKNKNYKVISMKEAYEMIKKDSVYGKYIVLTFDDGYEDFYMNAFPILKQFNYPSTIYLVPGYIESDRVYPWDDEFGKSNLMDWQQIKELSDDELIEIGSHTLNHYNLNIIEEEEVRKELEESKDILEERTGKKVVHFAYPKGIYSEEAYKIMYEFYETGVLIFNGLGVDNSLVKKQCYLLKRMPVSRSDTRFIFIGRIKGWIWLEEVVRNRIEKSLRKRKGTNSL